MGALRCGGADRDCEFRKALSELPMARLTGERAGFVDSKHMKISSKWVISNGCWVHARHSSLRGGAMNWRAATRHVHSPAFSNKLESGQAPETQALP
jgi:hypothetical protein